MPSLTLKNLPEDLLRALRKAAADDHRSLTQEVVYFLEAALRSRGGRHPRGSRSQAAQLSAWRKLAGKWHSETEPEAEAAGLVAGRTPGREVDL